MDCVACQAPLSFNIFCEADLVMLNFFILCLSLKLLISTPNQNEGLDRWNVLGHRFFLSSF